MQYDLCLIVNLHPKQHYKHLQPIYFKHADISQLPDFVAIQQFHSSRTFVEVVAIEGEDFLICNFINIKV